MGNIGNLTFGIGGDDKELRKILDARKKDAIELQKIFSSFQLGSGRNTNQINDIVRLQEKQNRLETSNLRLQDARERNAGNSLLLEQRLTNAIERGNGDRLRTLRLDTDRITAEQRIRTETERTEAVRRRQQVSAAQLARIEQDRINNQRLVQQRLLTEIERTAAARRRAAMAGVNGATSYNNALGLTNKTLFNQRQLLMQLSNAMGIYFSIYQVGAFVKELATVSGEFEKQRLSLAAILQDKEAADKLFGQIKNLAVVSPFNFKELTGYAKQLSAFSIPTNELYDTMKRLADVSAGLGVDMQRIILAFGQVRSASVLRGQELRQFTEAGIPLVDELANKFTKLEGRVVSAGEVFDKISNREVPFAMIKEIFEDLTNEGGKFFNMQEIQATSLAGKISNLRDAYDIMLDSIGSANSDLMKGSVDGLVNMMEHWEKYWDILKGIILTYGTYKASIIVITTGVQVLTAAQKAYNMVMLASIISGSKLSAVIDLLATKLNNLSKATKVGLVLSAIVAIGYAIKTAYDNANKLDNALNEIVGKVKGDADASVAALDLLLIRLKNANQYSQEYKNIIAEINKKYGEYLPNLIQESETYSEIGAKLKGVTAAIYEKAKALSYSQSVEKLESELSESISKAYDSAMKSLTTNKLMGYDQYVLSKDQANKVVSDMFSAIRNSPELYKQQQEVEKLISETMTKAYAGAGKNIDTSYLKLNDLPQLDGMINGVKEYAKAFSILPEKQEEFFAKNEALFGANINYAKSIDEITKKHENLTLELSKQKFITEDDSTAAKTELQKKRLEEMVAVYKKFGQQKLADDIQKQLNDLNNATVGWRVELQKVLGNTIQINADSNINDVLKEMKEKYKDIKTRMDEQKPILLKAKFDFTSMSFPSPLVVSESMRQIGANFKVDSDDATKLAEALKLLNMQLSNLYTPKNTGGGGSKKDKFTDELKLKIDLIKDAKKEYDELLKLMSKKDAFKKLSSITEYKDIKQSDISSSGYTDYLKNTIKQLETHIKKNPKSDTAKNLLVTLTKEVGGLQIGEITKKAKDEIDKIEKYLSQHKEKFNLYKQIFEITGDKGQAAQIVFGDPAASIETYIDAMKSQLKTVSGGGIYEDLLKVDQSTLTEPVQKMVEDISDAIQEQDFTLKVDMAKIIADYATTEEKITAIHNRYEKLREEARKSNASQSDKNKAVAAYDSAEHKEISELQDELLKLTPFYRQLFADLSDIGYRHLKKLAENAGGIVDTMTNTKLQTPQGERLKYGQYNESGKQTGYYLPNADGSVSKTVVSLREYESILRKIASIQKDMNKENPFQSLISSPDSEQYKNVDGSKKDTMDVFASKAMNLNSVVQDVGGSLSGMFDALGNQEAADTTAFIGEMVGAASNVAMGIASGNPVQMIQGIVGGITAIAKNHDKKLDRAIEKSKLKVKGLQNAYSDLERFLSRQLGAVTSKQAKEQIKNLETQRREIQSQMQNEQDKKKTDDGAVLDYQNQISELNDKIRYFYEDLAGEQFGIKIKDWAKNISDSLVDAWSKGEDAAKAFDKSVADIMKSVFKNVLQLQYIEPAMKKLRKYLFGDDGKGGVLGDGELSQSDMSGLVNQLSSLKGDLNQWKTAWDYLTQAAKQAGIDLEEQISSDNTLSKGIEAVTEDTASLLASYINAMRADLSIQRTFVQRILQNSDRNTNTFALMQADIMLIQMNTLRTANNTDRLVELSEDTFSILRNASINGSGVKFNIA